MRKITSTLLGILLAVIFSLTAFAGQWKQETDGRWWYQNDDGSYPFSCWQLIDGKYYYFDSNGYLLVNAITPDGCLVGADGAWIQSQAGNPSSGTSAAAISSGTNSSYGSSYTQRSYSGSSSAGSSGTYYWTPSGKSYHTTPNCRSLSRSKTVLSGSLSEAKSKGKTDPCNNCVR